VEKSSNKKFAGINTRLIFATHLKKAVVLRKMYAGCRRENLRKTAERFGRKVKGSYLCHPLEKEEVLRNKRVVSRDENNGKMTEIF
jgi:hypothetical protein